VHNIETCKNYFVKKSVGDIVNAAIIFFVSQDYSTVSGFTLQETANTVI